MRSLLLRSAAPLAGILVLYACSSSDSPTPTAPACDVHAASKTSFTDKTAAWGLTGAVGNRLTTADLDGDGYPDLVVGANAPNKQSKSDLSEPGPRVFMNRPGQGGGRTFVEATKDSGFFQVRGGDGSVLRSAHVTSFGDVDNDGDIDAFSGSYVDPTNPSTDPGDRSEILLNDGKGHFTLAPPSDTQPPKSALWPTTGATMLDADRDGKLDVFVGFWYEKYGSTNNGIQAQLYRGNGDGSFASITDGAGLKTQAGGFAAGLNHRPAYGVTSCDLDGDGSAELMVSAYGRQWNLLYQNDGTGKYTEVGRASGYASDANVDYKDNQFFACYCTLHASNADCQGVAAPTTSCPNPADSYWQKGSDDQPWRNGGNTFATYCGDLDGDGKLDLYSAEIHHWHIGQSSDSSELLRNVSDGSTLSFERPGNAVTGMVWPHPTSDWNEGGLMVAGGDLDGDGLEDVVVAASDYPDQFSLVFHQKPDHTFEEVGQAWGLHHACASGLTVADIDRDGDLDVIVGSGTARDCANTWKSNEIHVYENQSPHTAKWLLVKLVGNGKDTNTSAYGARVTVKASGKVLVKELDGSYGHMGMQNDTVLFFGLGDCAVVDSVEVRWPNQELTVEKHALVNTSRMIEIRQGDATVRDVLAK